ncbi:MAG: hypothetical protein FJ264_00710 [Planctomycetes bacterium]|nr:hypothetical protein [Planctomycetota bacterium]
MCKLNNRLTIGAYVYPGWHTCPERDRRFPPCWSEWELVLNAPERFDGHQQPRIPLYGTYDDALPSSANKQVCLAREYGVDFFIYGFFWSRGIRVLDAALDSGFLGQGGGKDFPFALMWANRMPRGVLPVKNDQGPEIDPGRLVYTDPDDFMELIQYCEERYFSRPNYFLIENMPMFSIFDSTFFLRQLGVECAHKAIKRAKEYLIKKGYRGLHLMAINPSVAMIREFKKAGFDSVSHYVWLPEWKGKYLQDYGELTDMRSSEWHSFAEMSDLAYYPSVSPGWDASPRGEIHGQQKPFRYPWWPIVVNEHPKLFSEFLGKAIRYTKCNNHNQLCFIASWNEWSEGHYLEPDTRFGTEWLEAVRREKSNAV